MSCKQKSNNQIKKEREKKRIIKIIKNLIIIIIRYIIKKMDSYKSVLVFTFDARVRLLVPHHHLGFFGGGN